LTQQIEPFGSKIIKTYTRNITARPVYAGHQAKLHRITITSQENNWNGGGCTLGRQCRTGGCRKNHRHLSANKINGEFTLALKVCCLPAIFDVYVPTFNIPKIHQPLRESRAVSDGYEPDDRDGWLLRAHTTRPSGGGAKDRNELASAHLCLPCWIQTGYRTQLPNTSASRISTLTLNGVAARKHAANIDTWCTVVDCNIATIKGEAIMKS
jgi:hypothetical protein